MKVIILAGGLGSRLSEETTKKPKPMVKINKKPFLWYIMKYYSYYGQKDFIICAGYKWLHIKKYFKSKSIKIETVIFKKKLIKKYWTKDGWSVIVVNTGLNTMTGGRIKKLKKYLNNERFMLTYGDGLSNVNLSKLLKLHIASKKIATVTAVHPPARFGEIVIKSNRVAEFNEKIQSKQNWINGGFFVFEPEFLNYIKSDQTSLEAEPLTKISKEGLLGAYKHEKFWQCMDTMKDKKYLEELWKKKAPWK